jgi:hypothetical protein
MLANDRHPKHKMQHAPHHLQPRLKDVHP